jgi:UDP-N-acetylmuramate--alanine ligase
MVYIDDYAHHPTEISAFAKAIADLYSNKKVIAIFQPHLYSRTRDFADDFKTALAQFETLWLMPIYPARELPMANVSSECLLTHGHPNQYIKTAEQILADLETAEADVVLTIGAGDIDRLITPITEIIKRRSHA